jgi:hypothetical protein
MGQNEQWERGWRVAHGSRGCALSQPGSLRRRRVGQALPLQIPGNRVPSPPWKGLRDVNDAATYILRNGTALA